MRNLSIVAVCAVACALAQTPEKTTFEGRAAYVFANDKLELTILQEGGAMTRLIMRDDSGKVNPLWEPIRMARESGQTRGVGSGPISAGHFVCVDGFGPTSREERAAGLPGHGEAHAVPWELAGTNKSGNVASITFQARLPVVQEVFTRKLQMADGENVIYVESELESLTGFDRPACWAEHATIGSPFLEPEKTVVDMSAQRGKTRGYSGGQNIRRLLPFQDFTWPMAPGKNGQLIDLRAAPADPNSMDHVACLMDTTRRLVFVTALRPDLGLVLGYVFRREEFPWLQIWENYPRNLKLARGLEFSTQPFDVPRREVVQNNSMFDTPTYRWLPAKSKIGSRFLMFWARTPEGMKKIDDVTLENGRLVVEDRANGKRMTLAASLPL